MADTWEEAETQFRECVKGIPEGVQIDIWDADEFGEPIKSI